MLRNAFRGKPIGSLRPRSSGIGAEGIKVRFAPNVECGEGFLRPAECAGKQTYGGPCDVRSSAEYWLGKRWRASRDLDGVCPGGAFGASRLTTVAAAVSFGIATVLLWVKYERCVNESVDGGVFR